MNQPQPPAVDIGDPPGLLSLLGQEMAPTPGRFGNMLRLWLFTMVAVSIGEAFRIPDVLILVYIGTILFTPDAGSTTMLSVVGGGALVLGTGGAILVFMVSLSQPAIRLPMMALMTFLTGFAIQGTKPGKALQIFGMWLIYNIPSGDTLLQDATGTAVSGNTTQGNPPDFFYMPPEEALLHTLLWNCFSIVVALVILFAINAVIGRDPAVLLRTALAERLDVAAALLDGQPDARTRLARLARAGTSGLIKLHGAAGKWRRGGGNLKALASLIYDVDRLCLALLAATRSPHPRLEAVGAAAPERCRAAATALRRNKPIGTIPSTPTPQQHRPAGPLTVEISAVLADITKALAVPSSLDMQESEGGKKPGGFFVADAWTNPTYVRSGVKLTIAATFCYLVERLSNWPGIGTCLITVFVVSLETAGQTVHKALLRIGGCLVGAALGISTILVLMPHMTTLGDLLLVMSGPMLLAAWVKSGSDRINYAGQQIFIAYFVCILSGFGPTLDMEGAKDRIFGILLGDITVYVIYTTLWPVSVASVVRESLAKALEALAGLTAPHNLAVMRPADRIALRNTFDAAIAGAQAALMDDPLETTRMRPDRADARRQYRLIDSNTVTALQSLLLPTVLASACLPEESASGTRQVNADPYAARMGFWFKACAQWIRSGANGAILLQTLPQPRSDSPAANNAADEAPLNAVWETALFEETLSFIRSTGALPTERGARESTTSDHQGRLMAQMKSSARTTR